MLPPAPVPRRALLPDWATGYIAAPCRSHVARYRARMLDALSVATLGFLLGVRHAADADHVIAVTTIVSRERSLRRAGGIGALWGVGHAATVCLVGGAIVLLRLTVPPRLGLALEFAVALMLIGLGLHNLLGRDGPREPSRRRPVLVGMVHGLAGSAAVALLVLATIRDTHWALAYLLVFGLGTIAGMVLVTAAIVVPSAMAAARIRGAGHWLGRAAGAGSLCLGLYLAHQMGVADGLFTAEARWTPQ